MRCLEIILNTCAWKTALAGETYRKWIQIAQCVLCIWHIIGRNQSTEIARFRNPSKGLSAPSSTSALSNKAHGRALTLCMTIHRLPLTNPQSPSYTSSTKRDTQIWLTPLHPFFQVSLVLPLVKYQCKQTPAFFWDTKESFSAVWPKGAF